MKILIFSVAYHPFVGGAEVAVKEITDRIGDKEFHMVTVNLDGRQLKEEKIGNVFIHRVGRGGVFKHLFPILALVRAARIHREIGLDETWSIMASYGGFSAILFKFIYPKIRFVLTLQEGDPIWYIKFRALPLYPLFLQIFRKVDIVQTISNYLADFARSMGSKSPIIVIPNGVDIKNFTKEISWSESFELSERLGKKDGDFFLITASRLVPKNGISDVIKSLVYLPDNVKFLVCGEGKLESKLRKLSRDLGVSDRVKFLGFVDHGDLPRYFKVSDLFIRPSLSEGLGNSFLEAMAAGLPVIATSVGGIPDFLIDHETGLFCQKNDPKSVSDAIGKIMKDVALVEKIKVNARALVVKNYSWELVAGRMNQEVLSR